MMALLAEWWCGKHEGGSGGTFVAIAQRRDDKERAWAGGEEESAHRRIPSFPALFCFSTSTLFPTEGEGNTPGSLGCALGHELLGSPKTVTSAP